MQPFNPNSQSNPQANTGGSNPNDPNNFQNQPQYDQYGQPITNAGSQYQQPTGNFYTGPQESQQPTQPGYSSAPTTGFDPYAPNISHFDYNTTGTQGQTNYDPYQSNPQPAAPVYNETPMANEMPGVNPTFQDKKRGNNLFIIIAVVVAVILAIVLTILIVLNLNKPANPNQSNTANSSQTSSSESVAASIQEISSSSSSQSSSTGVVISRPTNSSANSSLSASQPITSTPTSIRTDDIPVVVF